MTTTRILVGIGAAAAAVTLVVGCSSSDSGDTGDATATTSTVSESASPTGTAQAGAHNDADVAYVQMMIPHHQQAVEMAEMVPSRSQNPDLIALAAQIQQAQAPEIEQMQGWLADWGVTGMSPSTSEGTDHGSMGHDMTDMPGMSGDDMSGHGGMMTAEQMQALDAATGPEFDRMWLEMMIEHHEGAVDSSDDILQDGESEQVRTLAQQIVSSQQAEITQMQEMLNN
ncbi:DUF305 domain-containing protein [Prescottella sp. R16]|uniref:DUF305 domain-containing protein n=1 Tax=Prescottella sp. R16 TaxID=3064529 RepID=UPI00272EBACB|nr:DUF305 domain-containing protein [Prescottella sp. R16]